MGIYEKLMNIQGKLKAPKNQYNEFSNFYYTILYHIISQGVLFMFKPLHNYVLLERLEE